MSQADRILAGEAWPSATVHHECPEGSVYCTIAEKDGAPYWVDIRVSRAGGGEMAAACNAIAILCGGALRRGLTPAKLRLYLRGIAIVSEDMVEGGKYQARSAADAVARTLEELYL
jgi:hypothetical protein